MTNKRITLGGILFLMILLISGCETAKGVAVGIGTTVGSTVQGAAKDTTGLCHAIMTVDNWIKKNLW